MKTIFTTLTATMIAAASFAQQFNSVLNFRLQNNAPFALMVNGIQINNFNNRATVENLRPGRHQITVTVPVEYIFNHPRQRHRSFQQTFVVFNGWINVSPNRVIYASLDRFNKFVIEETFTINNHCRAWNCQLHHHKWNDPVFLDDFVNCEQNIVQPLPAIIDAVTFQQLKESIRRTPFESTKQSILFQVASSAWFTTHQVRELVGLFSFESTKLDVAKRMFDRTVDKQNYFIVNNEFTFSSSIEDLSQYLAQR